MSSRLRDVIETRWLSKWPTIRLDLSLAVRNIFRQRRRSAIGLSAIASGVVALLLASGFFESNYESMREGTIRARIGHIIVTAPGYLDSGTADPFRFLMPETGEARGLIEAFPNVDTVAPRISFNGLISLGDSTVSFMADGVDPERERKLSGGVKILEGDDLSSRDAKEVILGEGLAQNLGIKVGQTVVLVANTRSGGVNALEVRVVGLFSTIAKAYDDFALRLPIKTAQELLRTDGVHAWLILLQATGQTDRMVERLRTKIPSPDLQFTPWHKTAAADFYNKTVSLFSKQVMVVKLMIAVIIVLSISNTMMTNVRERTGEIGTCMALGDTRRTVLRRFLVEGLGLGLAGGAVGVAPRGAPGEGHSRNGVPVPPPPRTAHG